MNSTLIRQTRVVNWLVAILWIALLVGLLLLHISTAGALRGIASKANTC